MVLTSLNRPQSPVESEEKYPALRTVLFMWKFLVVVLAMATVVGTYLVWRSPDRKNVALGLLALLIGTVACLFQWAHIELIEVFLDIEENTRRAADRNG